MRTGWALKICVLLMLVACSNLKRMNSTLSSYKMNVNINPYSGEISVNGTININKDEIQDSLSFHLHETFNIELLKVNGREVDFFYKKDEPFYFIPASNTIKIDFQESFNNDNIIIEFVYNGKLKEYPEIGTHEDQEWALDDQINSRMVELALYSRWYPLFDWDARFDIDMEVIMPVDWKCVCSGEMVEEKRTEQKYISRWISASDFDIVIVAAPDLKHETVDTPAGRVEFYYTQLPEKFIQKEAEEVGKTLNLFSDLLGKPNFSKEVIKHVYSPKRKGMGRAGYMRPGMIVTSEGRTLDHLKVDPDFSFLHDVAHEVAHFWWSFATGQGDWINETFAEYFSLVSIQKIASEEEYHQCIEKYTNLIENLPDDAPSLLTVPPVNDRVGYIVRYFKGSLMLDRIRNEIGDDLFFDICHAFYNSFKDKHIGTPEFRTFWGDRLHEHKSLMEIWIDSNGGLPNNDS